MKKALVIILILIVLIVLRVVNSQSTDDRLDDTERNRIILGIQFRDAQENLKRGFPFESSFFESKDAWGTPVRFETDNPSPQIRSAGPDKIFNTNDDLIEKE